MKYIIGLGIFLILGLSVKGQTKMNITELKSIVGDSQTATSWIRHSFKNTPAEDTVTKLKNGHPFFLDKIEWFLPNDSVKNYQLFGITFSEAYALISDDAKFDLYFVAELNNALFQKIYSSIGMPDKSLGEESEDGIKELLRWQIKDNIVISITLNIMANQVTELLRPSGNSMYSIVISNHNYDFAITSLTPGVKMD